MRVCRLEDLTENDIVAKTVMTDDYQVLLPEGTLFKKEYTERLKEFGIMLIAIKDPEELNAEPFTEEKAVLLKEETEQIIKDKVKDILEHHTYQKNKELKELSLAADSIISDILEEKQTVEQIYELKQRNADIYEHSVSICTLAILIAIKKKLSKQKVHDIGVGCLLHDLGLRYISIDYANKGEKELNDRERTEYKKHPVYGYSAVEQESWLSETSKKIILYHHEKKDGSGYPLRVKEIPIECQIVSVCDMFDEMICGIGYTRIKVHEAVEYVKTYATHFYNLDIVNIFLEFTAVYPIGSKVLTNEGQTAVVIRQNKGFPERPVLRLLEGETIDLLEKRHIFIDKILN